MKIAYITSSPYSGSTLLSFLMNAHPEIGTISEFDIMDQIRSDPGYLCSCQEKLRECNFFVGVKKSLNDKGMDFEFDDMRLMFSLSENERYNRYLTQKLPFFNSSALEKIRDDLVMSIPYCNNKIKDIYSRNKMFMETVLEITNTSVFLDANKNPYRIKYLDKKFVVKAIYLYKNGIAGAFSIFKSGNLNNRSITFKAACNRWFLEQITINRYLSSLDKNKVINLAYSDLCSNTESELNRVFNFLDLDDADVSDFFSAEHHIIGNTMRVSTIDSIQERLDWKDKLSKRDVDTYMHMLEIHSRNLAKYNDQIVNKLWSAGSI